MYELLQKKLVRLELKPRKENSIKNSQSEIETGSFKVFIENIIFKAKYSVCMYNVKLTVTKICQCDHM